jgi:hypothetical protein
VWRHRPLLRELGRVRDRSTSEARRVDSSPADLPSSPSRQRVGRPGAVTRVSARSPDLLARTSAPSPAVVRQRERKCSLLRFSHLKHFTPLPITVLLLASEQAL